MNPMASNPASDEAPGSEVVGVAEGGLVLSAWDDWLMECGAKRGVIGRSVGTFIKSEW